LGLDFKFTVIGGLPSSDSRFDFLKKINGYQLEIVEHLDWGDNDAVPEALSCFDVGVMPLVSDPKTEGKCAFKIIQYMGVGLPAIASPVGENSVVIQDGLNGYLADDTDEWVQYLSDLSQDSELRYSIGSRASHRVKDSYSYEYAIPKVVNALKSVVYEN